MMLITKYNDKNDLEDIHTTLEGKLMTRRTNLKLEESAKRRGKRIVWKEKI